MDDIKSRCSSCVEIKDSKQFNKNRSKPNGLQDQCRKCQNKSCRKYNTSKKGAESKYLYGKKYRLTDSAKQSAKRSMNKYKNALLSRYLFSRAIIEKRIERVDVCELCASTNKVQGHHSDYDQPLNVRWLCPKCHSEWHIHNSPKNNKYGIFHKKQNGEGDCG